MYFISNLEYSDRNTYIYILLTIDRTISFDGGFTLTLELDDVKKEAFENVPSYVSTEPVEYQNVDSGTIKSEMPDGAENSSLHTATTEEARGDGSAEPDIDEGSELDEEKNESEICKRPFSGRFVVI